MSNIIDVKGKILQLQSDIKPFFNNIIIEKYKSIVVPKSNFNLLDTDESTIFAIDSTEFGNDYNTLEQYLNFLTFVKTNMENHNREFQENKGKIINPYVYDENYRSQIEQIAKKYEEIYLDNKTYSPLKTQP